MYKRSIYSVMSTKQACWHSNNDPLKQLYDPIMRMTHNEAVYIAYGCCNKYNSYVNVPLCGAV